MVFKKHLLATETTQAKILYMVLIVQKQVIGYNSVDGGHI